ncbi:hypothetical protein [Rubritalea tangerina]|uniref:hypothetical protein n=1 Tax=Rubritalea tangerina TaxID=430798 RepID=UPI00360F53DD
MRKAHFGEVGSTCSNGRCSNSLLHCWKIVMFLSAYYERDDDSDKPEPHLCSWSPQSGYGCDLCSHWSG